MNMMARNVFGCIAFALVIATLLLSVNASIRADDFSLRLTVNGDDISETEAVEIDPDGELAIDLRIFDNVSDITLHELTVDVIFADTVILTVSEPLGDSIAPGEEYHREIPLNARELLKLGDATLTTGIYRTRVGLEYAADDRVEVWSRWVDIQVVGNPLLTPVGGAGVASGLATVGLIYWLTKGLTSLSKFAAGKLESLARGRVVGGVVNTTGRRFIRERCPVCGERFKNGYCYTCRKSAKVIRREYRDSLKDLARQGEKLLADGITRDNLAAELNISGQLAADVLAVIKDARLFRAQSFGRWLMVKAILAGICFAISTVIWVTVGGFAVLNTAALVSILIAATAIPLAVTWGLRIKAKRALQRSEL